MQRKNLDVMLSMFLSFSLSFFLFLFLSLSFNLHNTPANSTFSSPPFPPPSLPPPSRFISIRHFSLSPPPLSTCEYKTILQPGLITGENPEQFFFSEKSGTSSLNTKSIYPIRKKFSGFSEVCSMVSLKTKQRGVDREVKCLLNPIELTLEPEV